MALGDSENVRYLNEGGEEVTWRFVGLRDLRDVLDGSPADGAEIYSQHVRGEQQLVGLLPIFWST
jgi:hypothetical protein